MDELFEKQNIKSKINIETDKNDYKSRTRHIFVKSSIHFEDAYYINTYDITLSMLAETDIQRTPLQWNDSTSSSSK
jgi:hypothetical protein